MLPRLFEPRIVNVFYRFCSAIFDAANICGKECLLVQRVVVIVPVTCNWVGAPLKLSVHGMCAWQCANGVVIVKIDANRLCF
jgi:hypothetical protein